MGSNDFFDGFGNTLPACRYIAGIVCGSGFIMQILCIYAKKIDYFHEYGIILLVVSPTAKWTAKSVSNSNGVTTQMAMRKRIAIFYEEKYADRF